MQLRVKFPQTAEWRNLTDGIDDAEQYTVELQYHHDPAEDAENCWPNLPVNSIQGDGRSSGTRGTRSTLSGKDRAGSDEDDRRSDSSSEVSESSDESEPFENPFQGRSEAGNSQVYPGVMTGDKLNAPVQIYLKCSYQPEQQPLIESEGEVYAKKLSPLQGKVVPQCYGVFHGQGPWGENIACLFLEDVGTPYTDSFKSLSDKDKASILNLILEIHRAGIAIFETQEQHVLERNGQFRIIDFHEVSDPEHKCRFEGDFTPGDNEPLFEKFYCKELWSDAGWERFDFWPRPSKNKRR